MTFHCSKIAASPLPGVFVTTTESDRAFPRHWHGSFGLGVIDRGAQRSASGRGEVEARAGNCITHNPGEVHDGTPIGDAGRRWRMFHIEPHAMAALLGRAHASGVEWHAPVLDQDALRTTLHRAFDAANLPATDERFDATASRGLLEESLLLAVGETFHGPRVVGAEASTSIRLAAVMERLRDDVRQAPSLDELAALGETSRFSLVRKFRHCFGLPPMAWLQQLRLQRARDRIAAGWALADAALACGFSDQSHLTRVFTRQFGYTPGCWRRASAVGGSRRATTF